jgi:hypothetical protein
MKIQFDPRCHPQTDYSACQQITATMQSSDDNFQHRFLKLSIVCFSDSNEIFSRYFSQSFSQWTDRICCRMTAKSVRLFPHPAPLEVQLPFTKQLRPWWRFKDRYL